MICLGINFSDVRYQEIVQLKERDEYYFHIEVENETKRNVNLQWKGQKANTGIIN